MSYLHKYIEVIFNKLAFLILLFLLFLENVYTLSVDST